MTGRIDRLMASPINDIAHSFPFVEGWPTDISEPAEHFLQSWLKMRHGRLMPRKSDIDPAYIPKLLSMIWMYEYLPEEDDFICHLHGETIREAWGFSLRGQKISEFFPADVIDKVKKRWHRVIETPAVMHTVMQSPDEIVRTAERMMVPVTDDEGAVRYLLGLSLYADLGRDRVMVGPRGDQVRYFTIRTDMDTDDRS